MAAMCHFWRLTPAEYWALTVEEHAALGRFMDRMQREAERAARAG